MTLNYGLRWEPYFPIFDRKGGPIHFDYDSFLKGIKSTRFDTTPAGVSFPGDPGFHGREGQDNIWTNFSPRVGFAWDVNGDGRTSVRASAGTFYDFPFTQYQNLATAPPYFPRFGITDVDFENPWANYPGGDPFPLPYGNAVGRNAPWPTYSLVNVVDYDTPNMQVYSVESQPAETGRSDWLVSASYLGNHTHSPLVHAAIQSRCLPRTGCRARSTGSITPPAPRRQIRNNAGGCTREPGRSDSIYGFMRQDRYGRHRQLQRPDLLGSAPRGTGRHGQRELHMVPLHHAIRAGARWCVGSRNNDSWTNPDNRHC